MRHRLTSSILVLSLLVPASAYATPLTDRVAQRRDARLQQIEQSRTRTPATNILYRSSRRARVILSSQRAEQRRSAEAVQSKRNTQEELMEERVITLVNEERAKYGLAALRQNDLLQQAALGHAKDMYVRNYFSHESPEGKTAKDRIEKTGYLTINFVTCRCSSWSYVVGENIARGQETPEKAMNDWLNSPSHKENILSPEFAEIGIALFNNVWVQNFGKITTK